MHYQLKQEKKARKILKKPEDYPALKPIESAKIIFRIWRYHSLGTYSSWLLYQLDKDFFVRRLEWDRTKDNMYFGESEPTIYGSETRINDEQTNLAVNKLFSLKLQPFQVPSLIGIDGITYGVDAKFENLKDTYQIMQDYSLQFSWWSEPPDSWKVLADWMEETVCIFDNLLPASTAKMTEEEYMF